MKKSLFLFEILVTGVALSFLTMCQPNTTSTQMRFDLPITTNSEIARKEFIKGVEMLYSVKFDEAKDHLNKAINADSTFALAHLYKFIGYFTPEERYLHLKKAVQFSENATEDEQILILSWNDFVNHRISEGEERIIGLAEKYPSSPFVLDNLGLFYFNTQNYNSAIQAYEKTLALDSTFAEAYNILGYSYMQIEDYGKAGEAFKKYVELKPNEPNPHDSYADYLKETGNLQEALVHYKKAYDLDKSFIFSARKAGFVMGLLGNFEEAQDYLHKAMEKTKKPIDKIYFNDYIGNVYTLENKPDLAIETFNKAIQFAQQEKLSQAQVDFQRTLAEANRLTGNTAAALEDLKVAKTLLKKTNMDPITTEDYRFSLASLQAQAQIDAKDYAKASSILDSLQLWTVSDNNAIEWRTTEYNYVMSCLNYHQGNLETALEYLQKTGNKYFYHHYLAGKIYQAMGQKDEANKMFKKVLDKNAEAALYGIYRNKAQEALQVPL